MTEENTELVLPANVIVVPDRIWDGLRERYALSEPDARAAVEWWLSTFASPHTIGPLWVHREPPQEDRLRDTPGKVLSFAPSSMRGAPGPPQEDHSRGAGP